MKESAYKGKFQVTEYVKEKRTLEEDTIISILTADEVDLFRPMREVYGLVKIILDNPSKSKELIRHQLCDHLRISYSYTGQKQQALLEVINYVRKGGPLEWNYVYSKLKIYG